MFSTIVLTLAFLPASSGGSQKLSSEGRTYLKDSWLIATPTLCLTSSWVNTLLTLMKAKVHVACSKMEPSPLESVFWIYSSEDWRILVTFGLRPTPKLL